MGTKSMLRRTYGQRYLTGTQLIIEDSLTPMLDWLANNYYKELQKAMKLIVAREYLDICNNWVPKCPVDSGRLLASSAVFVDSELVGGGHMHGQIDEANFFSRHGLSTDSDYIDHMESIAIDNRPTSIGGGIFNVSSNKEVYVTVTYSAPYAVIQHEGINPTTGQQFKVYTREGSGPKFVESKHTIYRSQMMDLLGEAAQFALDEIARRY